jgi:multidrug efflux pump
VAAERLVAEGHRNGPRPKVEEILSRAGDEASIRYFASYLGNGSPRFYLPLDQQLFNDNFAQLVITTHDIAAREDLKRRLEERTCRQRRRRRFGAACARACCASRTARRSASRSSSGFRRGPRRIARLAAAVASVMRANPHLKEVNFDWNEMGKMIRIDIDQDRARALGISSQELAGFPQSMLTGVAVTQMREGDQLVDVVARAAATSVPASRRWPTSTSTPAAGVTCRWRNWRRSATSWKIP